MDALLGGLGGGSNNDGVAKRQVLHRGTGRMFDSWSLGALV